MENFNEYELIALNNALFYLRFKCTDREAINIKASSLLSESHIKIINMLENYYKNKNIEINYHDYIENNEDYLLCIISSIRNIENWENLEQNLKLELIETIVKPFKIKENTITFLLNYTNS